MNGRYLSERAALTSRDGDTVEVTTLGGPTTIMALGPTLDDYVALARAAYVRGDLDAQEFEAELDRAYEADRP